MSVPKIYLNENLSWKISKALREYGYNVVSSHETGMNAEEDDVQFDFDLDIGGRKIRVRFFDGELTIGHTIGYSSNQPGFFMVPLDTASNNKGVFVIKSATEIIEFLDSQN